MKLLKSVLATAALATLATSAVQAATTIRITGSTAYRTAVTQAIEASMGGAGNFKAAWRADGGSVSSELNAKASIFQGNITGANNPVTIKCFWSGSVGGVKTVANNLDLANSWLNTSFLPGSNTVVSVTPGSATYENDPTVGALQADMTMSDTRQTTTKFTSPVLTATKVGVVPFVWVKSNGAPSGLSNMTGLLARSVYTSGTSLAQFTGNSADTALVFGVGRDQDSGTRVAAFAESGFGTLTTPTQWRLNPTAGANSPVATVELYPAQIVNGDSYDIGSSGYGSGGNVSDAMNYTGSISAPVYDTTVGPVGDEDALVASGAYYVAYVGTSDAKNIGGHTQDGTTGIFSATNLQVLTYNGVQYSFANVKEGLYSFWTYEYIMWRSSVTPSSDVGKVGAVLANTILTSTASASGLKVTDMHASRSVEGGLIVHN